MTCKVSALKVTYCSFKYNWLLIKADSRYWTSKCYSDSWSYDVKLKCSTATPAGVSWAVFHSYWPQLSRSSLSSVLDSYPEAMPDSLNPGVSRELRNWFSGGEDPPDWSSSWPRPESRSCSGFFSCSEASVKKWKPSSRTRLFERGKPPRALDRGLGLSSRDTAGMLARKAISRRLSWDPTLWRKWHNDKVNKMITQTLYQSRHKKELHLVIKMVTFAIPY